MSYYCLFSLFYLCLTEISSSYGVRACGRPVRRWADSIHNYIGNLIEGFAGYWQWELLAADREGWESNQEGYATHRSWRRVFCEAIASSELRPRGACDLDPVQRPYTANAFTQLFRASCYSQSEVYDTGTEFLCETCFATKMSCSFCESILC